MEYVAACEYRRQYAWIIVDALASYLMMR